MGPGLPRCARPPGRRALPSHPLHRLPGAPALFFRHRAQDRGELGQDMLDLFDHDAFGVEAGPDERQRLHVIEQREQRIPEFSDVDDHDRLAMAAELAQVICSTSSSSVPMPPGSAAKASARSNMMRLRSCMSRVTMISWARAMTCSRPVRNSGITPVTRPPWSSTLVAN